MKLVALYNLCLRRIRAVVLINKKTHIRDIDSTRFNSMLSIHKLFSLQYRIFYRLSLFIFEIYINRSLPMLFHCYNYTSHGYQIRGARRLRITVRPRNCDDMNFTPKFINLLYLDTLNSSFCEFKTVILSNLSVFNNLFNSNFCFFQY